MGFWDDVRQRNKNALHDNVVGSWRSLIRGTGGNLGATYDQVRAVKAEREAREREAGRREAARRLESQAQAWVDRLGPDRSREVKYNAKADGSIDVYFAGIGKPDGPGKGHIRILADGTEVVVREPYAIGPNAKRDATLLDKNTPDKRL